MAKQLVLARCRKGWSIIAAVACVGALVVGLAVARGMSQTAPSLPKDGRIEVAVFCDATTAIESMSQCRDAGTVVGLCLSAAEYASLPADWLECDGASIPASKYPELARVLRDLPGEAKPDEKLKLPDYRGMATWLPAAPEPGGVLLSTTMNQLFVHQLVKTRLAAVPERARVVRWFMRAR